MSESHGWTAPRRVHIFISVFELISSEPSRQRSLYTLGVRSIKVFASTLEPTFRFFIIYIFQLTTLMLPQTETKVLNNLATPYYIENKPQIDEDKISFSLCFPRR